MYKETYNITKEQLEKQIELAKQAQEPLKKLSQIANEFEDLNTKTFYYKDIDFRIWQVIRENYPEDDVFVINNELYVGSLINDHQAEAKKLRWNMSLSAQDYLIEIEIETDNDGDYSMTNYYITEKNNDEKREKKYE